ncbi:Mitochondrial Tricarboxylate Carrier (MTC) Family [Achlya hypogyna]|uniref:Mitochondrial Tricarboxylate Carrier (MTC) Family n=1 Tax=Achlya hypogyna TaxID=1202772 RepID=A0A1V9ZS46_ACHHY|nr:Mitochondrial Tricarboxylate Carrier (MTC) Family [Achlya hypogyna]
MADGRRFFADPDEATYAQRVKKTWDMLDVRCAFAGAEAVEAARRLVLDTQNGRATSDEATYQQALKLTRAVLHPDTGNPVLLPLRVSMIVPMNLGLDCGMILASTTGQTVFWQWLNQTYNALHYYANRNATNEDTTNQRIAAYLAATASSVGASLGVRKWATARGHPVLLRLAPFAAVAAADVLNLAVMRQSEFLRGVNVYNEDGDWVGVSKRCGAFAVASCIGGRIFAAAPILILPPLLMRQLTTKTTFWAARPQLRVPTTLAMVAVAIQCSVPLTFGLFRQSAQASVEHIEPEFRALRRTNGDRVRVVTYNKGL